MKILLADDNPQLLSVTQKMIEHLRRDTIILVANNGVEALAHIETHPDITHIITDYEMPGADGLQVVQAAKKRVPTAHIILTTSAQGNIHLQALEAGAHRFFPKGQSMLPLLMEILRVK
ncbi:MAG: hypothetical protein RLZZ347_65 [Candidatus Parcubacteria bacterium]|jgi:CheY-like chemotaxis protein